MSARIGSFGKVLSCLPILLVEALNPLFVISIALFVGLGYILTLLMPVDISHWRAVFWFSIVAPLILLMIRARSIWRGAAVEETRFAWRSMLPLLPLLFLAPVFAAELTHPDLQLPGHGDLHIGYSLQLLYGATPIESVFLAGYPANYYWLYHAYVAALVSITSLSVPTIGSMLNLLAILSSLLWIGQTLIELRLARPRTVYLGLLAILVYCSVNMTGIITLLGQIAEEENVLRSLRYMLLDGADRRLHSVLGKALNFGSMGLAIMFFCAAFYACVKLVKRNWSLLVLVLISASGIAGLAMQQMAALYIALVLLGGVLLTGLVSLAGAKSAKSRVMFAWRELQHNVGPAPLFLWLAISIGLSLAQLVYIERFASVNNNKISLRFFNEYNVGMLVAGVALLLPVFLIHSALVLRRGNADERFIQFSCVLGLILISVLGVSDDIKSGNQYKGIYFVAILMATSAFFALSRLSKSSNRLIRYCAYIVAAAFLLLTFSRIVWVNHFFIQKTHIGQFDYEGRHLVFHEGDSDQMAAYYWIRDHTPKDSIVIYPVQTYRYTNTFHERMPYVKKKQSTFTVNISAYDERVEQLSQFYSGDTSLSDYRRLLAAMHDELPGRPLYAIVDNSELAPELMAQRSAVPVFAPEGADTYVYKLNPGAGA